MSEIAKQLLADLSRKALAEKEMSDKEYEEKFNFVSALVGFFAEPGILEFMREHNLTVTILEHNSGTYREEKTPPDYELKVTGEALEKRFKGDLEKIVAHPPMVGSWFDIIPYNSLFSGMSEPWKPDISELLERIANRFRAVAG
jgi:hypothetical protein